MRHNNRNILFIPSGYPLIYHYLDKNIEEALYSTGQKYIRFHPKEPIERLQTILSSNNSPVFAFTLLGDHLSDPVYDLLKHSSIKLAVWLTEDPYYMDRTLQKIQKYDYAFTIDLGAYRTYLSVGFSHVYHLPLGTDISIFTKQEVEPIYQSDLLLVGYPYPNRIRLIEFLLENGTLPITVIGKQWHNQLSKKFRNHDQLNLYDQQWIEPEKVAKFYNGAKIVLNPHRPAKFLSNENKRGIMKGDYE